MIAHTSTTQPGDDAADTADPATFAVCRLSRELARGYHATVHPGETLSRFVETAILHEVERRILQGEG